MGYAEIIIWPARFILPISFALVLVVCVLKVVRLFMADDPPVEQRPIEEDATFRA